MATYKEKVGTAVQNIAGEDGVITGQLWYDSSDSEFKYKYQAYGNAWSTANSLNTARRNLSGAGTQTSALAIGGGGPPYEAITESWNGSSWTEVSDLNTGRRLASGCGADNTSALSIGGDTPPVTANTESWNGSSWTEVNDLNTARRQLAAAGVVPSALAFGGENPGAAVLAITESWNGTNWTEVHDLNTARSSLWGAGISNTAALAIGGYDTAQT